MKHSCCNKPLHTVASNNEYFVKKCSVCNSQYTQRKRKAGPKPQFVEPITEANVVRASLIDELDKLQNRLDEMRKRFIDRRAHDGKISKVQLERDIEVLADMMAQVLCLLAFHEGAIAVLRRG